MLLPVTDVTDVQNAGMTMDRLDLLVIIPKEYLVQAPPEMDLTDGLGTERNFPAE